MDSPLRGSADAIESALAKCLALTGLSSALVAVERRLRGRPTLSIQARYSANEQQRQWHLSRRMRWALQSAIESACPVLTAGWRQPRSKGVAAPSVLIAVPVSAGRNRCVALAAEGQLAAPHTTTIQSMQHLAYALSVDAQIADPSVAQIGELIRTASVRQDMLLHELRVPLSAAGLLLERLASPQSLAQRADDIDSLVGAARLAVQEAQSIMRHFSQLQALDQGNFPISPVPLKVREIVERAAALLPGAATSLHCAVPDDLPVVAADPLWLTHILTNLLENATLHTPPPHTADVTAALSTDGDRAVIAVTSVGSGVPLTKQESVIGPHQRHASTDDLTSKGLGLRIATYLATAMNGGIWMEGDGHRSTTFCVGLPVVVARDH
ncbi:MAG TPA: HAMP domain-containing sensor histidine kinase [Sideroxyarcus sp.]|nr:HAMP domain-containing sensor histidine kinase [Sideroxyarcus sp.]